MSSFLITSKTDQIDFQILRETWKTNDIKTIETGNSIIYLDVNERMTVSSYFYENESSWIYVVGAFFYKNFLFKESLEQFLNDFVKNKIDDSKMFGHFALLIFHNHKLHIIHDALGAIRIFSNIEKTRISTSFLGLWFSSNNPLKLNRQAFYERLTSGYITAPDTLVESIRDNTYEDFETVNISKYKIKTPEYKKGKKDVPFQVKSAKDYFKKMFHLADGDPISLGLSGGFDSRMLLGLFLPYANKYLFTHHTQGVHGSEMKIAETLSKIAQNELNVKETKPPSQLAPEEAEKLLLNLIYYYDGRTANNSGAFSETGTYDYNFFHLKGKVLGINGKGGEVFRNYYNLPDKRFTFSKWYSCLILYPSFRFVFSNEQQKQMLKRIENKIADRLRVGPRWSRWNIQRYYSEIRQADCESSIISAHNKITRYIAPYLDAQLLNLAYQSYEKSGNNSNFQIKFIKELNSELVKVQSNYGYPFSKIPLKFRMKEYLIKHLPLSVKHKRLEKFINPAQDLKLSSVEKVALKFLEMNFPEIRGEYCFSYYAQRNVVTNLVYLLKEAQRLNKLVLQ